MWPDPKVCASDVAPPLSAPRVRPSTAFPRPSPRQSSFAGRPSRCASQRLQNCTEPSRRRRSRRAASICARGMVHPQRMRRADGQGSVCRVAGGNSRSVVRSFARHSAARTRGMFGSRIYHTLQSETSSWVRNISHMPFGIDAVFGVWCLVFGVWCLVSVIFCSYLFFTARLTPTSTGCASGCSFFKGRSVLYSSSTD